MPLTNGTRIGSYEILAPIGAGGMGEVYRARDTKLKRDVAIKVLPDSVANDAERMARFQREAEMLAALNHPNIAAIYGVEERALVMELVEGESPKGPLPFDEAWKIASQIAAALEYAHDKGIIHRDLKPANVKVTPDGVVKLLDFGLAKALTNQREAPVTTGENSPTLTIGATEVGVILGTAAYMAPEQARGKQVDKRADIWAFGVGLYELLTGERLFQGEDAAETLAAVIHKQPDLSRVPAPARRLLERCLEKDPKRRLRDIGDAALLTESSAPAPVTGGSRRWPAIAAAVAFALIAAALAFVHLRETPPDERVLRFSMSLPDNIGYLSLSPDASRLAVTTFAGGRGQLSIRALNSSQFQRLPSADGARNPFWSPDSRFIGFFAEGKLKVVPAAGGPAQAFCEDTGLGSGGSWNRDGVILFASQDGPLRRVKAAGGDCMAVGKTDANARNAFPEFLPDGKHFLYFHAERGDESKRGTYIAALDDPNGRKILSDNSSALYAPPRPWERHGHLLFLREGNLMAQSFDVAALQTAGDPFLVATQASMSASVLAPAVSVAPDGTLVYLANGSTETQLAWLDRSGKELGKVGSPADRAGMSLSPDGNAVASNLRSLGSRVYDLARGSETRFPERGTSLVWSPDSARLVLSQVGQGLLVKAANGSGPAESLLKSTDNVAASDWSRDGHYLVYTHTDARANSDIWYIQDPGKPDSKPVKFLGTDAIESQGQLSPDGRWIAYTSNETGSFEVYARPFPSGPGQWKVSTGGAREPRWGRDGKELFFFKGGAPAEMFSARIQADGRGDLRVGAPQKLFDFQIIGIVPQSNAFSYSPHPDGKRFLVAVNTNTASPTINVITNWQRAVAQAAER